MAQLKVRLEGQADERETCQLQKAVEQDQKKGV